MTKNSNGIIKSMVIIAEKFRALNITEDDLIEAADAQTYLHLFENVEDFRQKGKTVYSLDELLLLILFAVLEKCNPSFTGIEDHIEANVKKYERYGLIRNVSVLLTIRSAVFWIHWIMKRLEKIR